VYGAGTTAGVLAGHQHTLRVHSAAQVDMLFVPVLRTTAGVLAGHQHTLRVHSAAQGRHALRAHSAQDYCRVLAETSAYSVSMVQHRACSSCHSAPELLPECWDISILLCVHSAARRHALRAHSARDYCRVLAGISILCVSIVQRTVDILFVPWCSGLLPGAPSRSALRAWGCGVLWRHRALRGSA
jgi:hypothetical protein